MLTEKEKKVFEEIIDICNTNNIELLFVSAPYPSAYDRAGYKYISSYINNLCKENNKNYLDFNLLFDEINLTENDFKDLGHLNYRGANKVSEYLAYYIKKNYTLK